MITTEKLPNGHDITIEWKIVDENTNLAEGRGTDENLVWHKYKGYLFTNEGDELEVDKILYIGSEIKDLPKHGLGVSGKLKFKK